MIRRILYRALYYPYFYGLKLAQLPRVLNESTPKIVKDEIVRPDSGSKYAIVVFYPGFGLDESLIGLLRALRGADINTIVVCNGDPGAADMERLRADAQRILLRPNVGRDFGAYRAASLHLAQQGVAATRMLYFNDSVIYLAGEALDRLVRQLAESDSPVVGTFENHEFDHHLGSYAFSMSGEVFRNPGVQDFWRRYRPYDIRPHAIQKGEIGLSRQMKKAARSVDVIYSIDRLAARLNALEPAEIVGLARYMPQRWRALLIDRTQRGPLGPSESLIEEFGTARPAARRIGPPGLSRVGQGGAFPRSAADGPGASASALATAIHGLAKQALIDLMISDISGRSQAHAGFGLYHVLMGSPMVKKDLIQRGIYLEQDCSLILADVPEATRAAIMRQLINRGRPIHWRGLRAFRYRFGFD